MDPRFKMSGDGLQMVASKPIQPYVNARNCGVRFFPMTSGSASAVLTPSSTYHMAVELPDHIDGIQVAVGIKNYSGDSPSPIFDYTLTAATGVDIADVNANNVMMSSRLTWQYYGANNTVGRIDAAKLPTGAGTQEAKVCSYQWSDIKDLSSVARTDGRKWGLLYLRLAVQATTTANIKPAAGMGSWQSLGAWNNLGGGQRMYIRYQAGAVDNQSALGSGFTSTTEVNSHPIAAIRYFSRGKIVQVAEFGGSTGAGGSNPGVNDGRSFTLNPIIALNEAALAAGSPIRYERAHVCFMEQNVGVQRGMYQLLAPMIQPNILVWHIIDLGSTFGQSTLSGINAWMDAYKVRPTLQFIESLSVGIDRPIVIPVTGIPCGTGFDQSGSDIVRQTYNANTIGAWGTDNLIDFSGLVTDPASIASGRATFLAKYANANNFHANGLAYTDAEPLFSKILTNIAVR